MARIAQGVGAITSRTEWQVAVVGVLCAVVVGALAPLERNEARGRKAWLDFVEFDRAQAGRWIDAHTPHDFTVAAYWGNPALYSNRYVYDLSFLNRRADEADRLAAGRNELHYDRYRPDLIVMESLPDSTPLRPRFVHADYVPVRIFDTALTQGVMNTFFAVYARRDQVAQISDVSSVPQCAAQDVCDRYQPLPVEKPSIVLNPEPAQSAPAHSMCFLGDVDETSAQDHASVDRNQPIELSGWSVMQERAFLPEAVWVILKRQGVQDVQYMAQARAHAPRPDLIPALGLPAALANSGFRVKLDASGLASGNYTVSILSVHGAKRELCGAFRLSLS